MTEHRPEAGRPSALSESEHIRRRRTARHLMISIMVILSFGGAIGALYWSGGDEPTAAPSPAPSASATASASPTPTVPVEQPTILIQVSGVAGAQINVLTALAPSPGGKAVIISLPPDLMVSAPGTDSESIRTTVSSIDTLRAPQAVAATLGVRIDGSWRMARRALAGLVDGAGGFTVVLDKKLRIRDGSGAVVLRLKKGRNELNSSEASWYGVGVVRGESQKDGIARGLAVLRHALTELPADVTGVRETLTALGALGPTTIDSQPLAQYLVSLSESLRADRVRSFPIPTNGVTLGKRSYEWVNFNRATPRLRKLLPLAQWSTIADAPPRVLVVSATGEPGWIGSARVPVESLGYVFVDGRGTPARESATTSISVRGLRPWGRKVASGLALPQKSVVSIADSTEPVSGRPWADVDVILQHDYQP